MATIRASFKRVIRLREYESETIELSVERNHDEINDGDAVKHGVANLYRQLAEQGDEIVAERLGGGGNPCNPGRVIIETERDPSDPRLFRPRGTPAATIEEPDQYA